jgi:hypothetical protein
MASARGLILFYSVLFLARAPASAPAPAPALLVLMLPLLYHHHRRLPTTAPGLGLATGVVCVYISCIVYRVSHLHVLRALSPERLTTALTGLHGPAAAQVQSALPVWQFQPQPRAPAVSSPGPRLASPRSSHWHRLCPCGRAMHAVLVALGCPSPAPTSQCADPNCNAASCLPVPEPNPARLNPAQLSPAQLSPARLSCVHGGKRA